MSGYKTNKARQVRRHKRMRQKISGTASRPRLCVSVTTNNMYVQFIDDDSGKTLAASSTLASEFKEQNAKPNVAGASVLGKIAAEKAKAAGISEVVFDRGGRKYHGRIKAIAEAAREIGLKF